MGCNGADAADGAADQYDDDDDDDADFSFFGVDILLRCIITLLMVVAILSLPPKKNINPEKSGFGSDVPNVILGQVMRLKPDKLANDDDDSRVLVA